MIVEKTFIFIDDKIHLNYKWKKQESDSDWDNVSFIIDKSIPIIERLLKKGYRDINYYQKKSKYISNNSGYSFYERGRDYAMDNGSFSDYWGYNRQRTRRSIV